MDNDKLNGKRSMGNDKKEIQQILRSHTAGARSH